MSRIDVVHRADRVSITLASHGFSMSVELSPSEADDLVSSWPCSSRKPPMRAPMPATG